MKQGDISSNRQDYDVVVVGASLSGCATALQLGRAGARVALVERRPDPAAFKRICSHIIQASAIPTLERLGLLEPILAAGGVRAAVDAWTRWGWIEAPPGRAEFGVNLRREILDPLVREITAAEPGVDLALGRTAHRLLHEDGAFQGVVVRDRDGNETELRGRLVVGADGRASGIAELAGLSSKTLPHERIAYGAYFEGALPANAPNATVWFLDPDIAAANPTDDGLVFYGAMPTKARMAEFKRDPEAALVSYFAALPDAPPIHEGTRVGPVIGQVDMPNRMRGPIAPGLALVGDAALATDPVAGVGCGWAFQSSEWLAESIAPALRGEEALDRGLARYRRRHRRELRTHKFVIHDFATGRRLNLVERLLMRAAAHDQEVAARFTAFGSRQPKTGRALVAVTPRVLVVNARQALSRRPDARAQTASDQA